MVTFGDLRGAVDLARGRPSLVGGVVWCVLHAQSPDEYTRWFDYAVNSLREPVDGYDYPLADVVRFVCEGLEALRPAVSARQRAIENPLYRLEEQDLVLFACALAYHMASVKEATEPQVAREGIYVDVSDGVFEISWANDGMDFGPGLNMGATLADVLPEHLSEMDGGVRLVAYDELISKDEPVEDLPVLPSAPADVARATWDPAAVVDPSWSSARAKTLGLGYRTVELSNLVKKSASWSDALRASNSPGLLAAYAIGQGTQVLPKALHAHHVNLATRGSLSCSALTLVGSRWLVRGDLHVDGVLELLSGAELCVLGSLTCGGVDVQPTGSLTVRGEIAARAVLLERDLLEREPDVPCDRIVARALRTIWLHDGQDFVCAQSVDPCVSNGDTDTELDRLDSMLQPVWRDVMEGSEREELLARTLHTLATLPIERVFTPEIVTALGLSPEGVFPSTNR